MKDISFLTTNLIAHRGLHDEKNPENSIGAFKKALAKKYIIELDIHLTKDNKIVVFHDDTLKRMTGKKGFLKDYTYKDLLKLNLKNTKYKIPLLSQVLTLVNGRVPIIIELKFDNKIGKLEKELVKLLDDYEGLFAVKSFSFLSVFWFRLKRSKYVRGQLLMDNNYLFLTKLTKPDFLSYNINNLPNRKITKIRKKKLILGWTINSEKKYDKGIKYCDNLICEKILK